MRSRLFALSTVAVLVGSFATAQDNARLQGGVQVDAGGGSAGDDGSCHYGWAACNVWHHDQASTGKYRLAATDCYPSLGRALDLEDQAFELNQQLRQTNGRAREPLLDQFNAVIEPRQTELGAYRQCISDWFAANRGPLEPPSEELPAVSSTTPENTWAEQLDEALGNIPYLQETDRFLAEISDFDMTRPHEGARIVAESTLNLLGEAGFSYLIKAVRPLVGRATTAAGEAAAGAAAAGADNAVAATGATASAADGAAARGAAAAQPPAASGGALGGRAAAGADAPAATGALGNNPALEAAREVGPPPRFQPDGSLYTDGGPPAFDPQGIRRYPHVDAPPPPTSIGEQIIADQVWAAQLPPGTVIPAAIRNLPRPVYLQESTHSCVLACSRMLADTHLGGSIPEQTIEQAVRAIGDVYVPGRGVVPAQVRDVLWQTTGINGRFAENVTIDQLAAATANGAPAIVALNGSHAVVVDGIIDTVSGPMVLIRDPANLALMHNDLARHNVIRAGFTNAPAIPLDDFMRDFLCPTRKAAPRY